MRYFWQSLAFLPAILLMILIFSFSAAPGERSSELSDGLSYKIVDAVGDLPFTGWSEAEKRELAEQLHTPLRKGAHFSEYALLAILWVAPLGFFLKKGRIGIACLICIIYACMDELHQVFIPGRDGNLRDVLIDTSGALAGLFVWYLLYGRRRVSMFVKKRTHT